MDAAPNTEQVKSLIRWFISTFGGAIAGWFAAKGWFTVDQVISVLNSPVLLGAASSIVVAAWGLFTHTKSNAVAVVNAIPEVKGVITAPTAAGVALAESIPAATVTVAGSSVAASVAAK